MKTVKQVSDLTGISVRMLHHYDKIELFKPSKLSDAGYRLYSDKDLEMLQQILFFRELDFPLKEIKTILTDPFFDRKKALANHKNLLTLKRNRLNNLINLVNKTMEGEHDMSFKEFDISQLEKTMNKYSKEAKERYGETTQEYKECEQKTAKYTQNDWYRIDKDGSKIFEDFAKITDMGEGSKEAQELVKKWQSYITENFYECTTEVLKCLGKMYVQDERFKKNIDKTKSGLAEFISKSIEIYCK